MDKKYLLEVRRQAVDLCILDGIMLTPENIINALSELGYIVAPPNTSVQADGALPEFCRECMDEFGHPDNCIGCPNRPAANANRSAASWLSEVKEKNG